MTLFFGWLFLKSLVHDSMLNRFLRGRVLCYVGRISYGLYVYSLVLDPYFYSIWARLGFHLSLGRIEEGCLKTATSIVVAAASWHFFEKPILSLKDRLAPDPGSSSGSRSSDQKGDT